MPADRHGQDANRRSRHVDIHSLVSEGKGSVPRADEAARLTSGELRVADLALANAWEHAAGAEMADLGRAVARADGQLTAARGAEGVARSELAQKKADLDVVAKDEARFDDRARRARDAAEEESADEAFAARGSKA